MFRARPAALGASRWRSAAGAAVGPDLDTAAEVDGRTALSRSAIVRRRLLLVHGAAVRQARRRDLDHLRLHRRQRSRSPTYEQVSRRAHRARRGGAGRPTTRRRSATRSCSRCSGTTSIRRCATASSATSAASTAPRSSCTTPSSGGSPKRRRPTLETDQAVHGADRHRDRRRRRLLPGRGIPPGLLPEEPDPLPLLPQRLRARRRACSELWGELAGR